MPNKNPWSTIVFLVTLCAYLPVLIGGWKQPADTNLACFELWIILAFMLTYSSKIQGHAGWKMQLGFFIGNIVVVALALIRGGYTYNLGPSEMIAFFGIGITISIWVIVGTVTKKSNPRILYLGSIIADVLSYYPVLKQYLLPHPYPTMWMIAGWSLFALGALGNVLLVERMPQKLAMNELDYGFAYDKKKDHLAILEESAFSLENFAFIAATVVLMCR